jgi:hypothetical protein
MQNGYIESFNGRFRVDLRIKSPNEMSPDGRQEKNVLAPVLTPRASSQTKE